MKKANQLSQNRQKQRKGKMSLAEHQPCAGNHFEHSSSMVGIDVPILGMRKQSFRLDNLAKVMGSRFTCVQDYFFWGCPAPGGKNKNKNPEASWRRGMLLSGCRHHATPQTLSSLQSPSHSYKHFSPFLTDTPPGADREKPRAHLTGNSSECVFKEAKGHGPEASFSVCQDSSV